MPATRRAIVKHARSCHSKAAWQRFFAEPTIKTRLASDGVIRAAIFSLLQKDPLSPNYDPGMWTDLIRSCQKAWDQPLAEAICHHVRGTTDPALNLAMAETLLEGGHPRDVRRIASRCLKQPDLDDFHRLNFELILSSGYLAEGKSLRAEAILQPIDLHTAIDQDSPIKAALTCRNIARMYFSKGLYPKSGMLFTRAAEFFRKDKNHSDAALSYYNSAAAYDNAGFHDKAMEHLSKANELAQRYNIKVVISYSACFSGVVFYQKGDHGLATSNLERALAALPADEQGMRRVHILSFLCLARLRLGLYSEAQKAYRQRQELCANRAGLSEDADFPLLAVEMLLFESRWDKALAVLDQAVAPLRERPIATIDELSLVAKYLTVSAKAGIKIKGLRKTFKVAADLHNHRHSWLHYRLALLEQLSLSSDTKLYLSRARELLAKGTAWGSIVAVQGAHAHILRHGIKTGQFDEVYTEHRCALARSLDDFPNSSISLTLLDIAEKYRKGDLEGAGKQVELTSRRPEELNPYERMVVLALSQTATGHAVRVASELGQKAVDTYARDYLKPTFTLNLPHSVTLADGVVIDLSCQATVARFLSCLINHPERIRATSELQRCVWNQSLKQKNWKQKIRNTVSRIRMLFKHALVPVVMQESNEVWLNRDIITFARHGNEGDKDAILVELLRNRELSSTELAGILELSRSTMKRRLKKALDRRHIQSNKKGRNIYYSAAP